MENIQNSQPVQSISNGPLSDKARTEARNTKTEFGNLAVSRQTPDARTATGQELTHYHSFFYSLLSWNNPRATAISYLSVVSFIFTFRYVPVAAYALKAAYIVLGVTAAAEIAGKMVLGEGIASKMRPRKYYTIPRETLESVLGDLQELVNFFVIEFQRIAFAENVSATVATFFTAFTSYFLVKIMPTWGLALLFTTAIYFLPLAYISNKEFIDHHLNNAQNLVSEQANQVRDLAAQHTSKAMEASQAAFKDYSAKATGLISQGKHAAVDNNIVHPETADKIAPQHDEFPPPPKNDPVSPENVTAEVQLGDPMAA